MEERDGFMLEHFDVPEEYRERIAKYFNVFTADEAVRLLPDENGLVLIQKKYPKMSTATYWNVVFLASALIYGVLRENGIDQQDEQQRSATQGADR